MPTNITADLAAEYWKLVQAMKRSSTHLPVEVKERVEATLRYSESKLETLLASASMRVQGFDGMAFEPGMAAVPENADEIAPGASAIVARTLEPAVLLDMTVVKTGKVFLVEE